MVLNLASDGIVITFGSLVLGAADEFYQIVQSSVFCVISSSFASLLCSSKIVVL